jgi:hypothetical protein
MEAMTMECGAVQLVTRRFCIALAGFRTALILAALVASGGALQAQEDTYAQRQACRPDVFRLCSVYIPRRGPITDCLQRNFDRLSQDCRAVFEGRLR